jgi:hypothetical protein
MKLLVLYTFFFLTLCKPCANAQIEKYITDFKTEDGNYDIKKVYKLIYKDSQKNMFLLSEYAHDFKILDRLRTDLLAEIVNNNNPEKIFYENSWEHDTLLKENYIRSLTLNDYKKQFTATVADSSLLPWWFYLLEDDYRRLNNSNYEYLIKNALKKGYADKMIGLDIGTITFGLGLQNLCKITQSLVPNKNSKINKFCDSLIIKYSGEFSTIQYVDTEEKYLKKKNAFDLFIHEINEQIKNVAVIQAWKSVFSAYLLANTNRNLALPLTEGGHVLTTKEFTQMNSFRDSVMYENFKYFLPRNWNNVVLSFSTLHLIDTNNQEDFDDVLGVNTKTLGRLLVGEYKPYLRRIIFICNSSALKAKDDDNLHYRQSLEYRLAKNYEMAYVDLSAYRNSKEAKKPFYMRPTFFTFRNLNWENIFDGIVFVKDCNCSLK